MAYSINVYLREQDALIVKEFYEREKEFYNELLENGERKTFKEVIAMLIDIADDKIMSFIFLVEKIFRITIDEMYPMQPFNKVKVDCYKFSAFEIISKTASKYKLSIYKEEGRQRMRLTCIK